MSKSEDILLHLREAAKFIRDIGECEKQPNCALCKMSKTCLRLCQFQAQLYYDIATHVDKS